MDSFQASIRGRAGRTLLGGAIATILAFHAASASADELSDLRERLEAQEQKIKVLERKLELNDEAAKTAVAAAPVVKAGPKGFNISSADNANQLRLRGTVHFDGRYFLDDVAADASDTWLLRRVRPTLEGTLGGIFDFRVMPDFAQGRTVLFDAWGAIRLKPWAVITAGKFKVPVGLERLASVSSMGARATRRPTSSSTTNVTSQRACSSSHSSTRTALHCAGSASVLLPRMSIRTAMSPIRCCLLSALLISKRSSAIAPTTRRRRASTKRRSSMANVCA
jgi:Phosphate-selective porin O and P